MLKTIFIFRIWIPNARLMAQTNKSVDIHLHRGKDDDNITKNHASISALVILMGRLVMVGIYQRT